MAKLSIITINWNSGTAVERTIASVLSQQVEFEWVVVDGGSTDGSLEALRAAVRPGDRLISEPDRGISDAFNKGLNLATGEAIAYMNAGDEYASPTALCDLLRAWRPAQYGWITGGAVLIDPQGAVLFHRLHSAGVSGRDMIRRGCRICHQSTLVDARLLRAVGGFDLSYRIAMDYELWCRLIARGHEPQVVPVEVCRFHAGGISGHVVRRWHEDLRARRLNGMSNPWWLDAWLGTIVRIKALLRGQVGAWAYRVKERLGW